MMVQRDHAVTVIEFDPKNLARLGEDHGCDTVVGDGLDEAVLKKAGIESADVFITCTRGDNTNLMAAQIAQKRYNVARVCAKVNDPARAAEYTKMGVFCIVPNLLTAGMMRCWILGEPYAPIDEFNNPKEVWEY